MPRILLELTRAPRAFLVPFGLFREGGRGWVGLPGVCQFQCRRARARHETRVLVTMTNNKKLYT